jgi:hypothetical protein
MLTVWDDLGSVELLLMKGSKALNSNSGLKLWRRHVIEKAPG